jgi:type VI protein secretion system component VasF
MTRTTEDVTEGQPSRQRPPSRARLRRGPMPLWVKVFLAIAIVVAVFIVVSLLLGVQHGPGLHGPSGIGPSPLVTS